MVVKGLMTGCGAVCRGLPEADFFGGSFKHISDVLDQSNRRRSIAFNTTTAAAASRPQQEKQSPLHLQKLRRGMRDNALQWMLPFVSALMLRLTRALLTWAGGLRGQSEADMLRHPRMEKDKLEVR